MCRNISSEGIKAHPNNMFFPKPCTLNPQPYSGDTPLMLSVNAGNMQAMQLLLDAGAKVDLEDKPLNPKPS